MSKLSSIHQIEDLYSFRNLEEAQSYLAQYPFIVHVLADAYSKIGSYFPQSPLSLEVMGGVEQGEEAQMVMFIGTSTTPDEALQTLNKFDDEWWLDVMDLVDGRLTITVEFI
jgi:hypothetical protein